MSIVASQKKLPPPLSLSLPTLISIMFSLHLNPLSFLHVQSLGWSPDNLLSIIQLTTRAESLPTPLQGFYLSCLRRCLGILMQKERMII